MVSWRADIRVAVEGGEGIRGGKHRLHLTLAAATLGQSTACGAGPGRDRQLRRLAAGVSRRDAPSFLQFGGTTGGTNGGLAAANQQFKRSATFFASVLEDWHE